MNQSARRFLLLLALSIPALQVSAATYYVDDSGNDNGPGTLSQPWRTLQHAANTVQGGDTILVRGGNYAGVGFDDSASGSLGNPTVLKAYSGEVPHITSDGPQGAGINLEGVSWMVVDGFVANDHGSAGIRAVGGEQWGLTCEHVTIRNNHLDHNFGWGILTGFCDDLLIENNVATRSIDEHGIYVSNSGDRPIIRNNLVWGNNANGIHMNGDISSGGDGVISDAVVEGNIIYDNGEAGGSAINCDGVQDSVFRNNLLFDNHASGISLYRIDGGGPSTGNRVLNNTIIMASNSRWAVNIQDGSTGNTLRNNILWNLDSYRGSIDICSSCLTGFSSDYNVVMDRMTTNGGDSIESLSEWQSMGYGAHSLVANPAQLFVDAGNADYRLAASSPAIDAGQVRSDVIKDIVGIGRPIGASHDIGAYELAGNLIFADGFE